MRDPVRIAITGAAGNIGYALAFRIAAGDLLGPDQPVGLQLIEIPPAMNALAGAVMELNDCAFPLLHDIVATSELDPGFRDTNYAILVGSMPRRAGMERSDLLGANGKIFGPQGKALNDLASRDVRVLVVGNPANTNALIAQSNAADLDPSQFSAMTRLDHNRAKSLLAAHTGRHVSKVRQMTIWGNHSSTQYPDLSHATVAGSAAKGMVEDSWTVDEFIPRVQKRGAEVIAARGASSAASAASAAIDHVRTWTQGTPDDDWVSMAVPADGSYGIEPGVIYSYPCRCSDGSYEIVQGLEIDAFSRERMDATDRELREERGAVAELL